MHGALQRALIAYSRDRDRADDAKSMLLTDAFLNGSDGASTSGTVRELLTTMDVTVSAEPIAEIACSSTSLRQP